MSLYVKMARIMAEIGTIGKTGELKGGGLNYKYVKDSDVYNTVRELLARENIALFASMTHVQQNRIVTGKDKYDNDKDKYHTLAEFSYVLVDSESGETMTCTWFAESDDSNDKGVNKAATAALKYWLLKTFIIPTGDDPDSSNGAEQSRSSNEQDDGLSDILWTRENDGKRAIALVQNAIEHWKAARNEIVNSVQAYRRVAIIIGSESRPVSASQYKAMMADECTMSARAVWDKVLTYESAEKPSAKPKPSAAPPEETPPAAAEKAQPEPAIKCIKCNEHPAQGGPMWGGYCKSCGNILQDAKLAKESK
jgi:hypothetical protein